MELVGAATAGRGGPPGGGSLLLGERRRPPTVGGRAGRLLLRAQRRGWSGGAAQVGFVLGRGGDQTSQGREVRCRCGGPGRTAVAGGGAVQPSEPRALAADGPLAWGRRLLRARLGAGGRRARRQGHQQGRRSGRAVRGGRRPATGGGGLISRAAKDAGRAESSLSWQLDARVDFASFGYFSWEYPYLGTRAKS